jgi:hypothetical protein
MRSNGTLPMTDTRRISPQTTSSSGYHSDLSSATSANESPQSIQEILPVTLEQSSSSCTSSSSSSHLKKKTNVTYEKPLPNKNLSRLSSFIRKQYERAKSKFISKPLSSSTSSQVPPSTITTCTKATSTTPLSHLSEDNYTLSTKEKQQHSTSNQKPHYHPHYLSSVYKQNSFTEPVGNIFFIIDKINILYISFSLIKVYSVYVQPLHKITTSHQHKNYASIHECYSHQPSYRYSAINNSHQYSSSSSSRRLATMANFETNNYNPRRHHYYPVETSLSSSCENSYPYRYTNNNYDHNRSNYLPLSEFLSTKNSAFKPVKQKQFYQRPACNNLYEQVPLSTDPCDLEVAQYFPQTSQWSNPNYFDIYAKDIHSNYTETLC